MQRIGLYHAPDYSLADHETEASIIQQVRSPTDSITIAEYAFDAENAFTESTTRYNARLIQFHFDSPLLGIELETTPQSFATVVDRLPTTLSPVAVPAASLWAALDAADTHGIADLRIEHPVWSVATIEAIATPIPEKPSDEPLADPEEIERYYTEAREEQHPLRTIPYLRIPGTDAPFALGHGEDGPLSIGMFHVLTAGDLAVIGTFVRDHVLRHEGAITDQ